MAICPKCGIEQPDSAQFCGACGAPLKQEEKKTDYAKMASDATAKVGDFINSTSDYTARFDASDIQKNKLMAILSYITVLVLVPIFAAKDSPYARYHANQGLVLLVCELALGIACAVLNIIPVVGEIVSIVVGLVALAYIILGIVYAVQGKAKDLPVIGQFKLLP